MTCEYCGKQVLNKCEFCPNCGKPLNNFNSAEDYYNQGVNYYYGENGYQINYNKAALFFKKAADLKHVEAVNFIGIIYLEGNGMQPNYQLALQWFNYAIQLDPNFGRGYYNIGRMYNEGMGVQINYDLAYQYFMRAIKCGKESYYPYACHFIGYILFEIYKKPRESVDFFIEALKNNSEIAGSWHNLGVLYEQGYYRPSNGKTEVYFYEKAAELGFPKAMEALGKLYLKAALGASGSRRESLKSTAEYWLAKAANEGCTSAYIGLFSSAIGLSRSSPRSSSSSSSYSPNPEFTSSNSSDDAPPKEFVFYDGKGNYTVSGNWFYDFKGNLCEWGAPFYDSRGNYCEWGAPFYDGRGNYCEWGGPFYDSKGNYINPQ